MTRRLIPSALTIHCVACGIAACAIDLRPFLSGMTRLLCHARAGVGIAAADVSRLRSLCRLRFDRLLILRECVARQGHGDEGKSGELHQAILLMSRSIRSSIRRVLGSYYTAGAEARAA